MLGVGGGQGSGVCDGLNDKSLCLGRLGGVALLEESCHRQQSSQVSKPQAIPSWLSNSFMHFKM